VPPSSRKPCRGRSGALEDELIDVERAAAMLDMTEGALRKAVSGDRSRVTVLGTACAFDEWSC